MSQLKKELADFNTTLEELQKAEANSEQIQQNHFGDFLMIEEEENHERYRVWLNHPENVNQGESVYEIEYAGEQNGHTWATISKGYE